MVFRMNVPDGAWGRCPRLGLAAVLVGLAGFGQDPTSPRALGTERELFVDRAPIESLADGAHLRLHPPTPQEVAIIHDAPWEGNTCAYHTVFRDGPVCRMYYRASHFPSTAVTAKEEHPELTCYAESSDGIRWTKPDLGLVEFRGSTHNNIIWAGPGTHNFAPFRDTRPGCPPDEQYKALALGKGGLLALASADALSWRLLAGAPVITKGAFDSQNLAYWDPARGCYVDYHRGFLQGVRAILTCTSADFLTWTEPVPVAYPEGTPLEHLYTNQILAYPRAPHVKMGFPKRFLPDRRVQGNRAPGLSDGVFMTSRDGLLFSRWPEAFIRPGPQRERWVNRNNLTAWGLIETMSALPGCPPELSLYSTEGYYEGDACRLRRFTVRLDGFVSVNAPLAGGEVLTRVFTFAVDEKAATPAAEPASTGPVRLETKQPIRGTASLNFVDAAVVRIPGTQDLGTAATVAVTVRGVPPGHRRLFSAYNGSAIRKGDQELVFDLISGGVDKEGWSLRFMYDGLVVSAAPAAIPGWDKLSDNMAPTHIAATWADGVVCLYVNGRRVAQGGSPGGGALVLKLGDLLLGEDYPPTSLTNEPLLGMTDDILVLREALDEARLARLAGEGPDFLAAAGRGALYTIDADRAGLLTDRLTADGSQDAGFESTGGPLPGQCQLLLNCATSAAGSLRVEVQDAGGQPLPGLALADCDEIWGDAIERVVSWQRRTELKDLAGQPLRLRFLLRDADLYALRFGRPQAVLP